MAIWTGDACTDTTQVKLILQMPRRFHAKPLLHSLHWLPVDHRITYKMEVVTFKVQRTTTPAYLSRHLQPRNCVRNLWSSNTPLLCQPFTKTDLARRGFRYSAPAVWNRDLHGNGDNGNTAVTADLPR